MNEPITKAVMLLRLREAHYVTELPLTHTSPKFRVMLADANFAMQARGLVENTVHRITSGTISFAGNAARQRTLLGWNRMLECINDALRTPSPRQL